MIVDEGVLAADIVACVKESAGELAESVELFDVYAGKQIEAGKKSVAVSINYRSRQGNLSSDQVDEMQARVVRALEKRFKAAIRDK
jgi:phenylalanyl-tRNA synthetase beta chain